jgi:hypothetical protein
VNCYPILESSTTWLATAAVVPDHQPAGAGGEQSIPQNQMNGAQYMVPLQCSPMGFAHIMSCQGPFQVHCSAVTSQYRSYS